ncbi:MAG: hypothetical protein WC384_16340 [Prolixibacteraceae bacterium]|jgi:DUF1680 family protein
MKFLRLLAVTGIALFLFACNSGQNQLTVINSESFHEKQVRLDSTVQSRLLVDSMMPEQNPEVQDQPALSGKLDALAELADKVKQTKSDSLWSRLKTEWEGFRMKFAGKDGIFADQNQVANDSLARSKSKMLAQKWANLNKNLLQFSGEGMFGDAIEQLLYNSESPVLTDKFLKSIVFTHIFDQIFVNILASSSVEHYHTTGGAIKLIQETNYPESNKMTLTSKCSDVRYLDVFIRIPSWAVNPSVQLGNVKYVCHPGEYCQISRKWNDGDKIDVLLKN